MWFKTRVGLVSVSEPTEILIARYNWEEGDRWGIYAHLRAQQEGQIKSATGEGQFKNPTSYLAFFMSDANAQRAIGECMALIVKSIRDREPLCDLSNAGTREAWKNTWNLIQWPEQQDA